MILFVTRFQPTALDNTSEEDTMSVRPGKTEHTATVWESTSTSFLHQSTESSRVQRSKHRQDLCTERGLPGILVRIAQWLRVKSHFRFDVLFTSCQRILLPNDRESNPRRNVKVFLHGSIRISLQEVSRSPYTAMSRTPYKKYQDLPTRNVKNSLHGNVKISLQKGV